MKIQILTKEGKIAKEINTNLFEDSIREDMISKVIEAEKIWHPYSCKYQAGMNRSASGIQKKRRHVWKSDRGRGLSRIPRKIMSRRGTQFNWIGSIIPSARGGRKAHPPKGSVNLKKINKKELIKTLFSALTYVSSVKQLRKKYFSIKDRKIKIKLPIIVEEEILKLKTKEFLDSLKKIFGNLYNIVIQKKSIRAGKGKLRGRKNKKNAGLLFVIGKKEKIKIKGIEIVKSNELTVSDLATNGARLTMFSENAIKDLEKIKLNLENPSKSKKDIKNETTNN